MHGGTCENTAPDQYRCTCAEGLSGTRCEIVEHPCATQPCKHGGTCTLKVRIRKMKNHAIEIIFKFLKHFKLGSRQVRIQSNENSIR